MRAPPAPSLQNVLVSHPTTGAPDASTRDHAANLTGTTTTAGVSPCPDHLVAAAVRAADDTATGELGRRKGLLARVSRRWARISESLRRRRPSSSSRHQQRDLTTTSHNPFVNLRLRTSRGSTPSRQVIAPPVISFEPSQIAPFHATRPHAPAPSSTSSSHPQYPRPLPALPPPPPAGADHDHDDNNNDNNDNNNDNHLSNSVVPFSPDASQVILSRESNLSRERQARAKHRAQLLAVESAADDHILHNLSTSSPTSSSTGPRVRQVGARDDDHTLLVIPNVNTISFIPASHPTPVSANSHHHLNNPSHPSPPHHHTTAPQTPASVAVAVAAAVPAALHNPNHPAYVGNTLQSSPQPRSHKLPHLPRASGLMPMRSVRAPPQELDIDPPPQYRHDDEYDDEDEDDDDSDRTPSACADDHQLDHHWHDDDDDDDLEDDDDHHRFFNGRRPLHRLPTGMSNRDVEREMERAVVEIASDGDSDQADASSSHHSHNQQQHEQLDDLADHHLDPVEEHLLPDLDPDPDVDDKPASSLDSDNPSILVKPPLQPIHRPSPPTQLRKSRSRSDAHRAALRSPLDHPFARRVSSSVQHPRPSPPPHQSCPLPSDIRADKIRPSRIHDVALFEDDYLSFQGFHANPSEGRSYYAGMSNLLRAKRISSVTDPLSDTSDDDALALRMRSESLSRRPKLRSGRLPILRRKRSSPEQHSPTS